MLGLDDESIIMRDSTESIIFINPSLQSVSVNNLDGYKVWHAKHFKVNHGKNEFALDGDIYINGTESFWSITKRGLKNFNGVKVNFERHLKECEFC